MRTPNKEVASGPAPVLAAPDATRTPLPSTFSVTVHPKTSRLDGGRVLLGGSPLRLLRLSPRAQAVVARWRTGSTVGTKQSEQLLARRLVSAGVANPTPTRASHRPEDVTVVIPVKDRPEMLEALLENLDGFACIVVDDASVEQARTERIARSFGARLVALSSNVGPSGARNAGLGEVTTPLVAFIDSDCSLRSDWLDQLLGHFDDPMVAAVAPRIIAAPVHQANALSRFAATHSSLDRGNEHGLVRPGNAISFVPAAALIVRAAVVDGALFDPNLRGGEDVDVVWRLVAAGWDVRYVPSSQVRHAGPTALRAWLARRAFYGTTAGPLAHRHRGDLAPLHTSIWTAATWGLLAARRPLLAATTLATSIALLRRRLVGLVDEPLHVATTIAGGGTIKSLQPGLGGLVRAWSPALVLGLLHRRTRPIAALALVLPALGDWWREQPNLDPVRYSALHVADDLAYGSGVWAGSVKARTFGALMPRVAIKTRVWSSASLRRQLARRPSE